MYLSIQGAWSNILFEKDFLMFFKRLSSSIALHAFVCSIVLSAPIYAQTLSSVTKVAPGNAAKLDVTANGVDLLQIAQPNSAGVSHNVFDTFHVQPDGLVVNNSRDVGISELGGLVVGNPQLQNGTADLILNEVVGSSRSVLSGYTEIFGDRAEYILANPYGITCNGCGFINTPRVTLNTGTPKFAQDQSLSGFSVDQGDVLVEGLGLDARGVDYFSIIARIAKLQSPVYGQDVSVITGRNDVDYATLAATEKLGQTVQPEVAIDSSVLGGIYAGRIRIEATEKGVGVKLRSDLAANTSSLTLSADGNISFSGKAQAKSDVTIAAKQLTMEQDSSIVAGVEESGALHSDAVLHVSADALANLGVLNSGGGVAITSKAEIVNEGTISALEDTSITSASLTNSGVLEGGQALAITTKDVSNSGTVQAVDTLTVTAAAVANQAKGVMASNGALSLTGKSLNSAGTIQTVSALTIKTTEGDLNTTGKVLSGGALKLDTAGNLTTGGTVASKDAGTFTTVGTYSNIGTVFFDDTIDIHSANLSNTGVLESSGNVAINTGKVENTGTLQTLGILNISGDTIANSGVLASNQDLLVQGKNVNHTGSIRAKKDASIKTTGGDLNSSGTIASGAGLSLYSENDLITGGKIIAIENARLNAGGEFENSGIISSAEMQIRSSSLENRGVLESRQSFSADSSTIQNSGTVQSLENLSLLGVAITNTDKGRITSNGVQTLSAEKLNNAGAVQTNSTLTMKASNGDLISTGTLAAQGTLSLTASKKLSTSGAVTSKSSVVFSSADYHNEAQVSAGGDGTITADSVQNLGTVQSDKTLTLDTPYLKNSGTLQSSQALQIYNKNVIRRGFLGNKVFYDPTELHNSGTLQSGESLSLVSFDADNSGIIQSTGDLDFSNTGNFQNRNGATIASDATLKIRTPQMENSGTIQTLGKLDIDAHSGALTSTGKIAAGDTLSLNTSQVLTTSGQITSGKTATLTAGSTHQNTAKIFFGGDARIQSSKLRNTGTVQSAGDVHLKLSNLSNTGSILAQGNILAQAKGNIDNSNTLYALGSITLEGENPGSKATSIINTNGASIEAYNGDVVLRADQIRNLGVAPTIARDQFISTSSTYQPLGRYGGSHTVRTDIYQDKVVVAASPSRILSGRDIVLQGGTIENYYSQIAAGRNLSMSGSVLNNASIGLNETAKHTSVTIHKWKKCKYGWRGKTCKIKSSSSSSSHEVLHVYDTIHSTIQAAGNISGSFTNQIDNTSTGQLNLTEPTVAIGSGSAQDADAAIANSKADGTKYDQGVPGVQGVDLDEISTNLDEGALHPADSSIGAKLTAPAQISAQSVELGAETPIIQTRLSQALQSGGLFIQSPEPASSYTIETRPEFIDTGLFYGSRYFAARMGLRDMDDIPRAFGDAFVDTHLVRDQMFEQLSTRWASGFSNDIAQTKALIENGVAAASDLALTPFVELTAAQVSALTQDIVWYEKIAVNNQEVIVPKVYLKQQQNMILSEGGQIRAGGELALRVASLKNTGGLFGSDVALDTDGLENNYGTIAAVNNLEMTASGTIRNLSGTVSGANIDISAQDFVSETEVIESETQTASFADTVRLASVRAGNSLNIETQGNLSLLGTDVDAGGDVSLKADGEFTIGGVRLNNTINQNFSWGYYRTDETKIQGSTLDVGGNVAVQSGANTLIDSSKVVAAGDLSFSADGHLGILSGTETYEERFKNSGKTGGWFGGSYREQRDIFSRKVAASKVQSSGVVRLRSGGDFALVGSKVSADNIEVASAGNVTLQAVKDEYRKNYSFKSSGFLGLVKSSEREQAAKVRNEGSELLAARTVTIKAGSDGKGQLGLVASRIEAPKIGIEAGIVSLISALDIDQYSYSSMDTGLVLQTMVNKGHLSEQAAESLLAADELWLNGARLVDESLENAMGTKAGFAAYLSSQQELTAALEAQGIRLESVVERYESWHEKTTTLAPAARVALSIAVGWATAGAGLAVDFGSSAMQQAMTQAVNGMINQVILSGLEAGITGNSDVFDIESMLRSAALTAATSFIGGQIEAKYNNLDKVQVAEQVTKTEKLLESQNLLQKMGEELPKRLIHGSVRAGLSTVVNGGNLGDNLKAAVAESVTMSALAGVQTEIGDLNLEEGSFNHALLHGIAGCAAAEARSADCVAGAAGAVAQSVYAGVAAESKPERADYSSDLEHIQAYERWQGRVQPLAKVWGALAGFVFSEGEAKNVETAAAIAESAFKHNYLKHDQLQEARKVLAKLRQCRKSDSRCSEEEIANLEGLERGYQKLSITNTVRMFEACGAGKDSCEGIVKEAEKFVDASYIDPMAALGPSGATAEESDANRFSVSAQDVLDLDAPINLDSLAVAEYKKALSGAISYKKATENIRTTALNKESQRKIVVGGAHIVVTAASVAACPLTGGLTCLALTGLATANTVMAANTASEGIIQIITNKDQHTIIENALIHELGFSEAKAARYLENAELLVGIADVAAGGALVFKHAGKFFTYNSKNASIVLDNADVLGLEKNINRVNTTLGNTFPTNPAQIRHIFRDAPGHLPDTPTNRRLLSDLTNNSANRLGIDRHGVEWFGSTRSDGTQVWGSVRNGRIQNGGLNDIPRLFNPDGGLSGG